MVEKAGGEKASKQEHEHYMSFHGTESHMSVVDLFIKGTGLYEGVFDRTNLENNRPGNNFRASVGCMLELKEYFHCSPNGRFVVHDPGFTRADIAIQRGNPVTGRILYDKALQVIANYKHALKHYKAFMDDDDNYPSGTTFEDMILDMRKKMYVEFKGCRNKPTGVAGRNCPEGGSGGRQHAGNLHVARLLCLSGVWSKTSKWRDIWMLHGGWQWSQKEESFPNPRRGCKQEAGRADGRHRWFHSRSIPTWCVYHCQGYHC